MVRLKLMLPVGKNRVNHVNRFHHGHRAQTFGSGARQRHDLVTVDDGNGRDRIYSVEAEITSSVDAVQSVSLSLSVHPGARL